MNQIDGRTYGRIARSLPDAPPSEARVAAVREALLAEAETAPRRRAGSFRGPGLVAAAALTLAVAGAAAAWSLLEPTPTSVPIPTRASITASGAATFTHEATATAGAEQVRLQDGTIRVEVPSLEGARPFLLVSADAEVEVHGAVFDVTVREARLTRVHVVSGRVEVRRERRADLRLRAGETWTIRAPSAGRAAVTPAAPTARVKTADPPAPRPKPATREVAPRPRSTDPATDPASVTTPPTEVKPPVPEHPSEVAFRAGWQALQGGRFEAAAEAFEAAAGPESAVAPEARYWRAVSWLRAGRARAAEAGFARFLELHPATARADEAALLLGRLRTERGDVAGAKPWLERAAGSNQPEVRRRARALLGR